MYARNINIIDLLRILRFHGRPILSDRCDPNLLTTASSEYCNHCI